MAPRTRRQLIDSADTPVISVGADSRVLSITAANFSTQEVELRFHLLYGGETETSVSNLLFSDVKIEGKGTFIWEDREPIILPAGSTLVAVCSVSNLVNVHVTIE